MNNELIEKAKKYVEALFEGESSGHDFQHTYRVYKTAMELARIEDADLDIVALASLLHDVDDRKVFPETYKEKLHARNFLKENEVDEDEIEIIIKCISDVEYLGVDSVKPSSIEGKCVQDADRIDALGAIGIARAFAYGGAHHRKMYDKSVDPIMNMTADEYKANTDGTTINHFYEKLFELEYLMNTVSGREEAHRRTRYMKDFLTEFLEEVEEVDF